MQKGIAARARILKTCSRKYPAAGQDSGHNAGRYYGYDLDQDNAHAQDQDNAHAQDNTQRSGQRSAGSARRTYYTRLVRVIAKLIQMH